MDLLRNRNVSTENLDFEDILRRFERRFGSSTLRSTQHSDISNNNPSIASNELNSERDSGSDDGNVSDHLPRDDDEDESNTSHFLANTPTTVPLSIHDFDDDLSRFLASFCQLPNVRNEAPGIQRIDGISYLVHVAESTVHVSRQAIRRELRHLTQELPDFNHFLDGNDASENRAIVASLKRQVCERNDQLDRLSRASKRRDVELRNVRDRLSEIAQERDTAVVDRVRVMEEKQRLLSRIDAMTEAVEKCESESEKMFYEKQRLERCIGVLRKDLLATHHERNAIQLEYDLLKERVTESERRNEENRKSESIIVPKVRELHMIQQEMLELMSQVDSGNVRARGALNMLNKKRTKILSRIATVVTKRTIDAENSETRSGRVQTSNRDVGVNFSPTMTSTPADDTVTESAGAQDRNAETQDRIAPNNRARHTGSRIPSPGTLQRKMTNMLRGNGWVDRRANVESSATVGDREYERTDGNSTGDGSSPTTGSIRNKYSALRYAGARAHEQAIQDLATLRELLELREKELRRVEDELEITRDKSDMLEKELCYEQQNRRRENRNLRGAVLTQAFEMAESRREEFAAHNTMFDWQNNPAPGDGEITTAIPKPADHNDDDDGCLSPVSDDSKSFLFGDNKNGAIEK